jgi:CBS domain containing-hemolysin-like protein
VFLKMLLVLLLVGANGFFVAAEFALVKIRLSEVKARAREGHKSGKLVENIVGHLDAYLSACQLGITLASLGLGWVGEPLVATSIGPVLGRLGVPPHNVHYFAFPLAFGLITFLHITAGEQVPKILAIQKYQATAFTVSVPLAVFYRVFKPFIWVLNTSSGFMLRTIGVKPVPEHGVATETELRLILFESAQGGNVSLRERLMMENVLDLEDKSARSCMLPRNKIVYIDREKPIEEQLGTMTRSGHTRLPVCDGDLDHVIGVIHVKDVFHKIATEGSPADLTPMIRPAVFFLETVRLNHVLRDLQKSRTIMALLVDEFGVVSGLITLENILEEVVGPIQDEFDAEQPRIRKTGEATFEIDASCSLANLRREINLKVPDVESDTVGGLVIELMGHIPRVGEFIVTGRHKITVTSAERTRVLSLSVEKSPLAEAESAGNPPPGAG